MKRFFTILTVLVVGAGLFATGVTLGGDDAVGEATGEKIVAKLQKRLELLEQRIERLEKTALYTAVNARTTSPVEPRGVPEDWAPFEFNGQNYYMVPLTTKKKP